MLFELTGATHVENGVTYETGDTVDSEMDLEKIFRGKFKRLDPQIKVTNIKQPKIPTGEKADDKITTLPADSETDKSLVSESPNKNFKDVTKTFTINGLDVVIWKSDDDSTTKSIGDYVIKNKADKTEAVFLTRAEVEIYLRNKNNA